jgi:hypothetical protein
MMKKKIFLFPILLVTFFIYGQNDTTFVSNQIFEKENQFLISEIDTLKFNSSLFKKDLTDSLDNLNKKIYKLDSILSQQNYTLKKVSLNLNSLNDSILYLKLQSNIKLIEIEELFNDEIAEIALSQSKLKKSLSSLNTKAKSDFDNLNIKISSKARWGYVSIMVCVLFAFSLFYVIRRKFLDTTSKLEVTSNKLESEQLKLDKKLIDLYESQMLKQKEEIISSSKNDEDIDHSLALKVGDEIIRMRKNLSSMPENTKGLKQLSKALQRIQDTFKINGYEMIEMLNKPYNEGMKVVANFVPDENLQSGQQIITRIIKPQINFNGIMIQSAQIEVSVSE